MTPNLEWLTDAFDPARALDPFCGSGSLLVPLARRGFAVVGVERKARWADLARERIRLAWRPHS